MDDICKWIKIGSGDLGVYVFFNRPQCVLLILTVSVCDLLHLRR